MRSAQRDGSLRALVWCLPVAIALGACSGAEQPASGSRDQWAAATADWLKEAMQAGPSGATIVLPGVNVDDVYLTSVAILGAGNHASELVDSLDRSEVSRRLHEGLTPKQLAASVAGPVTTALVIKQVDERVHLLPGDAEGAFQAALNAALSDKDALDLYTAAATVELATKLKVRVGDAKEAFAAVANGASTQGCQGSESLYLIGTAVSVGTELPGCSPAQIDSLWGVEFGKLQQQVGGNPKDVGVGESQALLALTRIAARQDYPAGRRAALVSALNRLDTAVVAGRSADVVPMSNDLDATGRLLGVTRDPAHPVLAHLRVVVQAGGEAQQSLLDVAGLALALRAQRAVGLTGHGGDLPTGRTPVERIELLLGVSEQPDRGRLEAEVKAAVSQTPDKNPVALLRGINALGTSACDISGAVKLAQVVAAKPAGTVGLADTAQGLAIRITRTCGGGAATDRAAQELLKHERARLDHARADDKQRPTLQETWQAVSVVCALDPAAVPDAGGLWDAYHDSVLESGGARKPGNPYVDLDSTFAVATMSAVTTDKCKAKGTLG